MAEENPLRHSPTILKKLTSLFKNYRNQRQKRQCSETRAASAAAGMSRRRRREGLDADVHCVRVWIGDIPEGNAAVSRDPALPAFGAGFFRILRYRVFNRNQIVGKVGQGFYYDRKFLPFYDFHRRVKFHGVIARRLERDQSRLRQFAAYRRAGAAGIYFYLAWLIRRSRVKSYRIYGLVRAGGKNISKTDFIFSLLTEKGHKPKGIVLVYLFIIRR